MTSIRERLRRLLRASERVGADAVSKPDPELAYTFHWTKVVREWDPSRRSSALAAVEKAIADEEFEPNQYLRKYVVPEVDLEAHAGASLLVLHKVLSAFRE